MHGIFKLLWCLLLSGLVRNIVKMYICIQRVLFNWKRTNVWKNTNDTEKCFERKSYDIERDILCFYPLDLNTAYYMLCIYYNMFLYF